MEWNEQKVEAWVKARKDMENLRREYRVVLLAKPPQVEDMVHNNDVVTAPTLTAYSYEDAVRTAHTVSSERDKWCVVGVNINGLWVVKYNVP